ncbi:MAG: glycogen/starch/alpha-glucan phosphorylase, partial [Lachnospiraceae bacterium]|nr:glycogen/starch/alpha-glucan phosphorylase [Lachnospiraceae bacterium]
YADRPAWVKMAMKQVAHVGMFSSDRTILEYINDIWHVDKLDPIEGEESI